MKQGKVFFFALCVAAVGTAAWWLSSGSHPSPQGKVSKLVRIDPSKAGSGNLAHPSFVKNATSDAPSNPEIVTTLEDWMQRWDQAGSAQKVSLLREGVGLAEQRKKEFKNLIIQDPRRAIESAFPEDLRSRLPTPIQHLVETRVSGRGDFDVRGAIGKPGQVLDRTIYRSVKLDGETYDAYVYGRREGQPSLKNIVLNGVALEGLIAVNEKPLRLFPAAIASRLIAENPDPRCDVSQESAKEAEAPVVAEIAGSPQYFCAIGHYQALTERFQQEEKEQIVAASARTEGTKRLIFIRVDFPDLVGEPVSTADLTQLCTDLGIYYSESSYGKTGFPTIAQGSLITPTFRMANPKGYYVSRGNTGAGLMREEAKAAATQSGITFSSTDLDIICLGNAGFNWAGLGSVGGPGSWIQSDFSVRVGAHELGHNYSLNHASSWDTGLSSPVEQGTFTDYGDDFDVMGLMGNPQKHFNAYYKSLLDWIVPSEVQTVTTNGVYSVAAHDLPKGSTPVALKFPRFLESNTNYWIEVRQRLQDNPWVTQGVGLRWAWPSARRAVLIDTTPGSTQQKTDSAIVLGRTFSDLHADIHITPMVRRGALSEIFDVVINRGPFISNRPPHIMIQSGHTTTAVNKPLPLQMQAYDPDGDPLAIYWDFGNNTFASNTNQVAPTWSEQQDYVVRCVVSDMKGGVASDNMIVKVGKPTRFSASGVVLANGWPVEGVRVSAGTASGSYRMCETDSSGQFYLANLRPEDYTLSVYKEGYKVQAMSFNNPVSGSAEVNNLVVTLKTEPFYQVFPVFSFASEWSYFDEGLLVTLDDWTTAAFDDTTWKKGNGKFGYGSDGETTTVNRGNENYPWVTTYFRKKFQGSNLAGITNLALRAIVDDGAIFYLNGQEIYRHNMPEGDVNFNTFASETIGEDEEGDFINIPLNASQIIPGLNVLAVEVHQANPAGEVFEFTPFQYDLGFDAGISGLKLLQPKPVMLSTYRNASGGYIAWPTTTTWQLEHTPALGATAWSPYSGTTTISNRHQVIRPSAGPPAFFRLKQ